MNDQQPTPSQTIAALQQQLQEAQATAWQAAEQKRVADEKVKQTQAALNGVRLGQQFAQEQAQQEQDETQPDE